MARKLRENEWMRNGEKPQLFDRVGICASPSMASFENDCTVDSDRSKWTNTVSELPEFQCIFFFSFLSFNLYKPIIGLKLKRRHFSPIHFVLLIKSSPLLCGEQCEEFYDSRNPFFLALPLSVSLVTIAPYKMHTHTQIIIYGRSAWNSNVIYGKNPQMSNERSSPTKNAMWNSSSENHHSIRFAKILGCAQILIHRIRIWSLYGAHHLTIWEFHAKRHLMICRFSLFAKPISCGGCCCCHSFSPFGFDATLPIR